MVTDAARPFGLAPAQDMRHLSGCGSSTYRDRDDPIEAARRPLRSQAEDPLSHRSATQRRIECRCIRLLQGGTVGRQLSRIRQARSPSPPGLAHPETGRLPAKASCLPARDDLRVYRDMAGWGATKFDICLARVIIGSHDTCEWELEAIAGSPSNRIGISAGGGAGSPAQDA